MADVTRLHREAGAERWGVTHEVFAAAVDRSTAKMFAGRTPAPAAIARYQQSLHLKDLALACACAEGNDAAWEHFVTEFRPALYRAADAIDRTGAVREIADALYGELFSRSLFRYFHGRSSLATWLRALLSQRYVDRLRERRFETPTEFNPQFEPQINLESTRSAIRNQESPDRSRFAAAMSAVLAAALALLEPRDRLRLRCYHAEGLTLAQIGRLTQESEATVSRQLARIRKQLRGDMERRLRDDHGMSPGEIGECISTMVEDPGSLNLEALLRERKDSPAARSDNGDAS